MNHRLLNEVLIEWNESSFQDSDNVFLKSKDIKKSFDNRYFIYRLNEKDLIKIFDVVWPEFEKYQDKVWINGKHVELDDEGYTINIFEPGEYKVYIKDIDKLTKTDCMFFECKQLVSAFIPDSVMEIGNHSFCDCSGLMSITIPDSVTEIGYMAFYNCRKLKTVYVENINKFKQIQFKEKESNPARYKKVKVIELKK